MSDNNQVQVNFKLNGEGLSLSVYDMSRPRGDELIDEWYATFGELGLEVIDHPDISLRTQELIIKPDGSMEWNDLGGSIDE